MAAKVYDFSQSMICVAHKASLNFAKLANEFGVEMLISTPLS